MPVASIEPLLTYLSAGDVEDAAALPGVSEKIIGLAVAGIQQAYSNAFTLMFLVSIAFGGCSIIAAWFTPAIEGMYTNDVMRKLHQGYGDRSRTAAVGNKQVEEIEHKEAI